MCSATMISYEGIKLWRYDNNISEFCAYFHCACTETAIKELPVKNLTLPFAPATSISYNRGITLLSAYIFPVIWRFV